MRNGFGGAGASHIAKTIRLLKDRGAQTHLLVRMAHCVSRQYPDSIPTVTALHCGGYGTHRHG